MSIAYLIKGDVTVWSRAHIPVGKIAIDGNN